MGNFRYRVWHWDEGITGQGSNLQYRVGVRTKAKRSKDNAYEVANEMLCLRLAEILKLPVPAGGVIEHGGHLYYASLDYSIAGEDLPPCPRSTLKQIAQDTRLTCGIIVFDSWIVNEDRGSANIHYDPESQTVYIIDHGRAMFYGSTADEAVAELRKLRNDIVVNHENHCLAKEATTLEDFGEWHQRILEIPEYYIRESVEQSAELGLPMDQVKLCTDFLLDRRDRLRVLFRDSCSAAFPHLKKTLFSESFEIAGDYCI